MPFCIKLPFFPVVIRLDNKIEDLKSMPVAGFFQQNQWHELFPKGKIFTCLRYHSDSIVKFILYMAF
jgi:hypothetical protein